MISVDLYKEVKYLEYKPSSFKEFCEEIYKLFNIEANKFTYEYLTNDKKYNILDMYNYEKFYKEEHIQKIFAYAAPNEANTFIEKPEEQNINNDLNNIIPNKDFDIVKQKIMKEQKEKLSQSKILNSQKEKKEINIVNTNINNFKNIQNIDNKIIDLNNIYNFNNNINNLIRTIISKILIWIIILII